MAAVYAQQYMPISNAETQVGAPLSVRQVRDTAATLNNHKRFVSNYKVRAHLGVAPVPSTSSNASEVCIMHFAPVMVPQGYDRFRWVAGGKRTAGTGTTTWRLYCLRELYRYDAIMTTSQISYGYEVGSLTVSSDTHTIPDPTAQDFALVRDNKDRCWLVLTAQNSDTNTTSQLTSLDVWPIIAGTESVS